MHATGELETLGFDEVEPGVIEDTPENRKRVYRLEGNWQFDRVLDENGDPTGLIRPVSGEVLTARREKAGKIYAQLLTDPENLWSDYVGPDEWPMDAYVPWWVEDRLRRWRRQDSEAVPIEDRKPFPTRCSWIRADETRCWMWVGSPQHTDVCSAHLRSKTNADSKRAMIAKQKLIDLTPDMVDRLEWYAYNAEGEAVGLKATTEILDRAGVRSGFELEVSGEVEVKNQADEVRSKLDVLRARALAKHEREQQERERLAAEAAETPALPPAARDTVQGEVSETRDDES